MLRKLVDFVTGSPSGAPSPEPPEHEPDHPAERLFYLGTSTLGWTPERCGEEAVAFGEVASQWCLRDLTTIGDRLVAAIARDRTIALGHFAALATATHVSYMLLNVEMPDEIGERVIAGLKREIQRRFAEPEATATTVQAYLNAIIAVVHAGHRTFDDNDPTRLMFKRMWHDYFGDDPPDQRKAPEVYAIEPGIERFMVQVMEGLKQDGGMRYE